MSVLQGIGILAAESLLWGGKLILARKFGGGSVPEKQKLWNEKRFYLLTLLCFLFFCGIFLCTGKELVILQYWDLVFSYLCLSIIDGKTHRIPDSYLIRFGIGQFVYRICALPMQGLGKEILGGLFVFVLLSCLSILSKGSVGMGDAKLLGLTAVFTGIVYLVQMTFWGMLCAFLYSIFLLVWKKGNRKTELPFVPFLALGMALHMGIWVLC